MSHRVKVLTDIGFGDGGKGTTTDVDIRYYNGELVVRYNGGAQAAHTVITPDGRCHVYHQFGSGTFVSGVKTYLSAYMLFNPIALVSEEQQLQNVGVTDAFDRLYVDSEAIITTPYHVAANRIREYQRGQARHGSCGMGIGETASDALAYPHLAIRVRDLLDADTLVAKLLQVRECKARQLRDALQELKIRVDLPDSIRAAIQLFIDVDELDATVEVYQYIGERVHIVAVDFLREHLCQPGCTIFEGAQGVLLDEWYGFHPYTTWSTTTPENALSLLRSVGYAGELQVTGILRTYQTRHGAGPFPAEDKVLTRRLVDRHNPTNDWQGSFRVGWLDLALLRYAIEVSGRIDELVMTCLDRMQEEEGWKVVVGYRGASFLQKGEKEDLAHRESMGIALGGAEVVYKEVTMEPLDYARWVANELGLPLRSVSWGAGSQHKQFLRP